MTTLRIGGGHRLRKNLFIRGLRQGWINVDEVEESIDPGTMTAAERWLLYFSLRAAEVELRDGQGRIVTPDDLVPDKRRRRAARPIELEEEADADEADEAPYGRYPGNSGLHE